MSREIPREVFKLVLSSCGAIYGDESEFSAFNTDDERITHYIVDRSPEMLDIKKNKEYVQPQWVFDCLNQVKLLPTSNYYPGKVNL